MSIFKKSTDSPKPQQPDTGKGSSRLDQLKGSVDVLNPHKMNQIEGGKSEVRPLPDPSKWNWGTNSLGDIIPS